MAIFIISNFTPPLYLCCFLLLFQSSPIVFSINITSLLSPYPDLSDFNNLLTSSSVSQDLIQRSSLTLLAVPNNFLRNSLPDSTHRSTNIADILRYHVLLQYLTWSELRQIPAIGKLVTTLYQTTGRANGNLGAVNITRNPIDGIISIRSPITYSHLNITLLALIKTLPYNVSIFTVNSLLIPYGFDLMASENRPPLGLNITNELMDGHNFNVAAAILSASGVTEEFEKDEAGAGITMFVPTDEAFAELPMERFQSLSADRKAVVLRFHVLHSYYTLGSLELIVNPAQPTLATDNMGAGRFTLNMSRINGSIAIDTGIVQASITQTVFDQNPLAIFGVSKVLLPKEIYGKESLETNKPGNSRMMDGSVAPPPQIALSPHYSDPTSIYAYSPGYRQGMKSNDAVLAGGFNSIRVAATTTAIYFSAVTEVKGDDFEQKFPIKIAIFSAEYPKVYSKLDRRRKERKIGKFFCIVIRKHKNPNAPNFLTKSLSFFFLKHSAYVSIVLSCATL
ncbi:Fasciclin-like arabinogalactan protein [Thalictrum thalictroides]|uniref:Fasciclin-like arabinogalactan protein n=1 Tax=Thalictrum thalictroides TaxID=46969 RepID=A0A7J6WRS1_THATH|nr:Fasciclin-like arabinogalactan protein [Thalictrum thalictroides]